MSDRTSDGRPLKILTIIDEHSRECLAIRAARQMTAVEVIEQLADLFLTRVSQIISDGTTDRSSRPRSSVAG